MKKAFRLFAKFFAAFVIVIVVAIFGYRIWFKRATYFNDELSREFYRTVGDANKEVLDLRKFRVDEWDEIAFWAPYESLCSLGIEGFDGATANCPISTDDGECYLVFLQKNKMAYKVPIDRNEMDLVQSGYMGDKFARGHG